MKSALQIGASFAAGVLVAGVFWRVAPREPQPAASSAGAPDAPAAGARRTESEAPVPATAPPTPSPAPPFPTATAAADLAAREQAERAQVVALQARVRELERRAAAEAEPGREDGPQRAKFHDFSDAELQAMAQNCEVRFDLPRIRREPFRLSPDLGARLHLSDSEQAQVAAAVDGASKDAIAHLRALYVEATGDTAGADTLDPQSLMREVMEKSPPAAVQAARVELARERAGFPPSPSNSIAERYLRYVMSVGDSLQHALEPGLGAQQAGAVRDALAENRSSMSGCPHGP